MNIRIILEGWECGGGERVGELLVSWMVGDTTIVSFMVAELIPQPSRLWREEGEVGCKPNIIKCNDSRMTINGHAITNKAP